MKDIVIIGAGVCGSAIARELSRYQCDVTVAEKGNDVSVGTSKANSGIVHGGFDAYVGSNKAKYNVAGNAMFDALAKELDFPFRRNGSLVLCFDEAEKGGLQELLEKGRKNGVPDLEIISGDEARALEPHISDKAVAALYAKTGGIVSPYEMTIAYAENANVNGVEFLFEHTVTSVEKLGNVFSVKFANGEEIQAKAVINCAGVYADEINNMVCPEKLHITARKGDYVLMDKTCGYLCDRTLFQLPTKMGKGVLVTPTTHGNVLVGPTARDVDDKDDVATTADELNQAFDKALLTVPELTRRTIITQFSGLRAHEDGNDFVVGESSVKGFYNVAGIESPGLTSAPAIAVEIARQVAKQLGLCKNANFVPNRKGIPQFSKLSNAERQKLIDTDPLYGKIVCRCETVTEGEIVNAIRRPLGAKDLDGVKRRTRAGMGRCQMGFCTPRIMEILSRELGGDLSDVTKCGGKSQVVKGRTK
ncbi:MAG: NAD(P)/FAD-dependent oxidoreductase [Corallococcus sp.]|nr:NAD(P)/FAD-dependent oxidoreductase [Corallococcus sp.]